MPSTHPAGGRVLYEGKPLAGATIGFISRCAATNRTLVARGLTDSSGRFVLRTDKSANGAIAGHHQVMVTKTVMTGGLGSSNQHYPSGDASETPRFESLIPERYALPETSGLTADVTESGPNEFVFILSTE